MHESSYGVLPYPCRMVKKKNVSIFGIEKQDNETNQTQKCEARRLLQPTSLMKSTDGDSISRTTGMPQNLENEIP